MTKTYWELETQDALTQAEMDRIEQQVRLRCTSDTRPASPVSGQWIEEMDTGLGLVYDGSSWIIQHSHNWLPWKVILNNADWDEATTGRYRYAGGLVYFEGRLTCMTALPTIAALNIVWPVTLSSSPTANNVIRAVGYDSSGDETVEFSFAQNGSTSQSGDLQAMGTSGGATPQDVDRGQNVDSAGNVPWTWQSGGIGDYDRIEFAGWLRP